MQIHGAPPDYITPFSAAAPGDQLPQGWQRTQLPKVPRETQYTLELQEGVTVLRAEANSSMSGWSHPVRVDPNKTPILRWRWKVSGALTKSAFGTKAGDDFAARVYVLFDYDLNKLPFFTRNKIKFARSLYGEAVPAAGLCYVWDAKATVGTSAWSAYTNRLRMIVAESGNTRTGQWVEVTRNVAEDFRAAFGEAPPMVSGVAIATDTDNTKDSVTAWYGDLVFAPGQ